MPSSAVPEIAYRFLADNADALKSNKQVKDSVEDIDKVKLTNVDASVNGLIGSLSKLVPVISAASLAGFAYSAVQAADAVGEAAARAQLSVGEFGRLQYIAAQTDVNFGELTQAIKAFRSGMDDAEQGRGNLQDGLERLNITVAELRGLNLEEQLRLIATRFQDVIDPTTRARIAQNLFNQAGQAMIPVLARGGDALKDLADEAEHMGQVFDDYAVKGADRLTTALESLKNAAKVQSGNFFGTFIAEQFGSGDELADVEHRLTKLIKRREELQRNPLIFGQAAVGELFVLNGEIASLEAKLSELRAAQFEYGQGSDLPFDRWRSDMAIGEFTPTVQRLYEEDEIIREIRKRREQEAADAARAQIELQADLDRAVARSQIENARLITTQTEKELERRHEIEEQAREIARGREKDLQDTLTQFRRDGANAAVTLLTAYGGKYKKFAQTILAVEKAHAIAKTIISTKAAAAAALEYYGPTPWGYAAAAGAIAYGIAQVAAIASTFIGGGSSAAGSPHNPVFVDTTQTPDESGTLGTPAPEGEQRVLQVIIQGNVYSGRETVDFLLQQLSQRINEYDAVIINPSSRQARELVPEPTT